MKSVKNYVLSWRTRYQSLPIFLDGKLNISRYAGKSQALPYSP